MSIGNITFARSNGGAETRSAVRAVLWRFVTNATRVVGSCSTWGERGEGVLSADRSYKPEELLHGISWYCR